MTDEERLARRAAADDAAAFAALVTLHEAAVRRFLRRLLRGEGADDLAQEVFLTAWRRRAAWRGEGSYKAWLMRIAWTTFLAGWRAGARRQAREAAAFAPDEETSADPGLRLDVERALARLDPRERAAAMLCFAEGHSHAEAAHILDLPLGTLKSVAARAKAKLKDLLEPEHDR